MFSSFFSSSKKQLGGQQVHQRCKFFNRLIRGSKRVNNYHFSGFYQRENLSTYHKIIMMTSFQTKTFYMYVSFHFKNIFSKFYGKSSVRKLSSIYILILILKQNYCVKNNYCIYWTLTDHTQKIQMKLCTYISAIHFCWKIDKKRDGGQDEDETKYFKIIGFADLFLIRKIFCPHWKKKFFLNNLLVSLFSKCVSFLLRI